MPNNVGSFQNQAEREQGVCECVPACKYVSWMRGGRGASEHCRENVQITGTINHAAQGQQKRA